MSLTIIKKDSVFELEFSIKSEKAEDFFVFIIIFPVVTHVQHDKR